MASATPLPPPRKLAFVTIGATASFHALLQATLTPEFLQTLSKHKYTDLLIQYGGGGHNHVVDHLRKLPGVSLQQVSEIGDIKYDADADQDGFVTAEGVRVTGFDFRKSGLQNEMVAARGGSKGFAGNGVCICHAGSGTVLDALRIAVPLIVVPNPTLLHNHQVELAEELERQGYVVHGRIDKPDSLSKALDEAERIKASRAPWKPVNAGRQRKSRFAALVEEEAGFVTLD